MVTAFTDVYEVTNEDAPAHIQAFVSDLEDEKIVDSVEEESRS